ncbi:MAG: DUF4190 domain-containing protein [Marmoricola sp.]
MTDPNQTPNQPYQPPYQPQYQVLPDHPQATTVLVLGILGLVLCGVIAPFAWTMGNRVQGEIDASRGTLGGRSSANAGRIMGIIGTVLLIVYGVVIVGILVLFGLGLGVARTTTSP